MGPIKVGGASRATGGYFGYFGEFRDLRVKVAFCCLTTIGKRLKGVCNNLYPNQLSLMMNKRSAADLGSIEFGKADNLPGAGKPLL